MTASSDSAPDLDNADASIETSQAKIGATYPISQPGPTGQPSQENVFGEGSGTSKNWLWLLGLAVLFAAGGFMLWRLFGPRNQGSMQGPPAFPVTMERLQEESLEDSSEYGCILESQTGVSLQPEADGRVTQIFVSSGDRVSAGDPIMQLSPDRSQSDYNAALASISAARSSRDTARAQLRAARERQTQLVAELELQETELRRTTTLVEQGALAQEVLDEVTRDRAVASSALNSAIEEIAALESSLEGAEAALAQTNAPFSKTC